MNNLSHKADTLGGVLELAEVIYGVVEFVFIERAEADGKGWSARGPMGTPSFWWR